MKDLSFFLLKNCLGAKMRKGFRNFCNGDASTSTLDQHKLSNHHIGDDSNYLISSPFYKNTSCTSAQTPPTLEEMILQLEVEEEVARKAKCDHDLVAMRGRMSCVNNSEILRSARKALNQYPRFSLDGKDAMYRSSFRNLEHAAGRKSVCCDRGLGQHRKIHSENSFFLPATLAGERVVWCEPGVIGKLMGLEAMPMPINSSNKDMLSSIIKRQNRRRRVERHEMERRLATDHIGICKRGRNFMGSCSKTEGYCVMKPVAVVEPPTDTGGGWPIRRFRSSDPHAKNQL